MEPREILNDIGRIRICAVGSQHHPGAIDEERRHGVVLQAPGERPHVDAVAPVHGGDRLRIPREEMPAAPVGLIPFRIGS